MSSWGKCIQVKFNYNIIMLLLQLQTHAIMNEIHCSKPLNFLVFLRDSIRKYGGEALCVEN